MTITIALYIGRLLLSMRSEVCNTTHCRVLCVQTSSFSASEPDGSSATQDMHGDVFGHVPFLLESWAVLDIDVGRFGLLHGPF